MHQNSVRVFQAVRLTTSAENGAQGLVLLNIDDEQPRRVALEAGCKGGGGGLR